jgi:3-oxoacyl-[acyl-carrier-protein] synthase-3
MRRHCVATSAVIETDGAAAVRRLAVLGTGVSLPGPALTTDELLARLGTLLPASVAPLARRLARRLGIHTRHVARALAEPIEAVRAEHSAPRLAAAAVAAALAQARRRRRRSTS